MKIFLLILLLEFIFKMIKKKKSQEAGGEDWVPVPHEASEEWADEEAAVQRGQGWRADALGDRLFEQQGALLEELEVQREALSARLKALALPPTNPIAEAALRLFRNGINSQSSEDAPLEDQRARLRLLGEERKQLEQLMLATQASGQTTAAAHELLRAIAEPLPKESSARRFFERAPLTLSASLVSDQSLTRALRAPLFSIREQRMLQLWRWPLTLGSLTAQLCQLNSGLDEALREGIDPDRGESPAPQISGGRLLWDLDAFFASHRHAYWSDLMTVAYGGEVGLSLLGETYGLDSPRAALIEFLYGGGPEAPPAALRLALVARYGERLGLMTPDWELPELISLRLDYQRIPVPMSFFSEALDRVLDRLSAARFDAYKGNPLVRLPQLSAGQPERLALLGGNALMGTLLSRWRGLALAGD
ncbi:MAG: hypothetical protein VYD19_00175, partial [Myxococcota bacterium]|nr:hypothetical protein [Myxococcota bacterium]